MSRISIQLADTPPVITESAIAVLRAHGFVLARRVGESGALEPVPPMRTDAVLRELGRNAAQALVSLDVDIDEPEELGVYERDGADPDSNENLGLTSPSLREVAP